VAAVNKLHTSTPVGVSTKFKTTIWYCWYKWDPAKCKQTMLNALLKLRRNST